MATKLKDMTIGEIQHEINEGGQFVQYTYAISIIVMSFRRASPIFLLRDRENPIGQSWPYIAISLVLGWWGFPWGPIWTIGTLATNLSGGKDVTDTVQNLVNRQVFDAQLAQQQVG